MMFIDRLESFGRYVHFAAQSLRAALGSVRRPSEFVRQFYLIYVGALPLAVVVGLSLGAVIWMHMHGVLVRLGSGYVSLLPEYLARRGRFGVCALGAGFIVAGRSAPALAPN